MTVSPGKTRSAACWIVRYGRVDEPSPPGRAATSTCSVAAPQQNSGRREWRTNFNMLIFLRKYESCFWVSCFHTQGKRRFPIRGEGPSERSAQERNLIPVTAAVRSNSVSFVLFRFAGRLHRPRFPAGPYRGAGRENGNRRARGGASTDPWMVLCPVNPFCSTRTF